MPLKHPPIPTPPSQIGDVDTVYNDATFTVEATEVLAAAGPLVAPLTEGKSYLVDAFVMFSIDGNSGASFGFEVGSETNVLLFEITKVGAPPVPATSLVLNTSGSALTGDSTALPTGEYYLRVNGIVNVADGGDFTLTVANENDANGSISIYVGGYLKVTQVT